MRCWYRNREKNIGDLLLIIHFLLRNPELVQNTHNCRYKHVNLSLLIYFTTLILSQSLAYSSRSQNFKKPKLILFSFKRLVELLPARFGWFYLFCRRNKSVKPKYKQGLVSINCGLICNCYATSPIFSPSIPSWSSSAPIIRVLGDSGQWYLWRAPSRGRERKH